ncbi:MAG TPA: glycosyl hydrolase family 28 protein [Acidobacteriaceae bacterium]|jgi:polygalacturonase|nr:glycosyl hydrolase family 28 protein [Acidobacteriaceae bacterium]
MKRITFLMTALALCATMASAQIAATSAKSYAKPPKRTKRYLITDFGAVADNKTVNTKAIQAAIDKCASTKKGGVVVVPAGTFRSGAIFLKQGVDLLVEKDGVLKGTTNMDDYPAIQSRWEGTEEMYTASLVNAVGVNGLTLSGEGTIDGSGDEFMANSPMRRPPPAPGAAATPRASGADAAAAAAPLATPPPAPVAAAAPPPARPAPGPGAAPGAPRQMRGRPRLIGIQSSKEVVVSGLHLHNQAIWCLFVLYSEDVEIDGVNITAAHNIPSSDGMDIDSSKHVHITNAFIDDDDDCISIKAGKDADGLRVNRPADDILIENSHFAYGQGGVAMGSETSGGIRNVTVQNCLMDSDNWTPIRFKSQPSRGGIVENITYKNIVLHGTREAFDMNMEWRMVGPRLPDSNPLPLVRNVKIINVSGDVQNVGSIHGLAGSPIQGVVFQNCHITATRGFRLDHARGVDLTGLTIDVKQGDPVTTTDVQ